VSETTRRRILLLLEYDGSRYAGSQYQENAPTVQARLEDAIAGVTGEPRRAGAAFAGRTDAGVHALGQVASFLTTSRLAAEVLGRALNARLPEDIVVRALAEAEEGFDVRRRARKRHYRYVIDNRPERPAIGREYAWHVARPLDADAMDEAARRLTGRRDFAAFASPLERPGASAVRDLELFSARRAGEKVIVDAVANAFLPHQVRRMVGALTPVGAGERSPAEYAALLDGPPASAGPAAPARGLYLVAVEYDRPLFGASAVAPNWGLC
jgi:tRNA pseudouridine38-40 synthase